MTRDPSTPLKCPWCDVVKPIRGLACHAGKIHKQPASELHRLALHNGVVPSCACGCGEPVSWLQRRYGEYKRGHNGFSAAARASALVTRRSHRASPLVGDRPRSIEPRVSQGFSELLGFVRSIAPDAVADDNIVDVPSKATRVGFDDLAMPSSALLKRGSIEAHRSASVASGSSYMRIFSDEWRDKRELIEDMIRHRLEAPRRVIGARSLRVVELTSPMRKTFFNRNHLEGDVRAKLAFGLSEPNSGAILVAISLREPFHKQSHAGALEIARFAVERGHSVQGSLSRLIKRALEAARKEGYSRMLSYADGRVGEGKSYLRAGFTFKCRTAPRFWWSDGSRRYNRFKVRADSKNGVTQKQAAVAAGVVAIHGCSNAVYEFEL